MSTERSGEKHRSRCHSDKIEAEYENSRFMPCPRVTYRHLLSTSYEPENPLRVIAHCDVDAAYAQFEASRLGIDSRSIPLVVLQWKQIIAVNYVARKFGVSRFNCTLEEAKQRCPELRLVHVVHGCHPCSAHTSSIMLKLRFRQQHATVRSMATFHVAAAYIFFCDLVYRD